MTSSLAKGPTSSHHHMGMDFSTCTGGHNHSVHSSWQREGVPSQHGHPNLGSLGRLWDTARSTQTLRVHGRTAHACTQHAGIQATDSAGSCITRAEAVHPGP